MGDGHIPSFSLLLENGFLFKPWLHFLAKDSTMNEYGPYYGATRLHTRNSDHSSGYAEDFDHGSCYPEGPDYRTGAELEETSLYRIHAFPFPWAYQTY